MEQNNAEKSNIVSIRDVLLAIKRNFILILVITLVCGTLGFLYTKYKKPVYTVTHITSYVASSSSKSIADTNITVQYYDTVIDFCNKPVVTRRADYYYKQYKLSALYIDSFIERVKAGKVEYDETNPAMVGDGDILDGDIIAEKTLVDDIETDFCINVSCTDKNVTTASEKIKIGIIAMCMEAQKLNTSEFRDSTVLDDVSVYYSADGYNASIAFRSIGYSGLNGISQEECNRYIDFCKSEEVINRANYYYNVYNDNRAKYSGIYTFAKAVLSGETFEAPTQSLTYVSLNNLEINVSKDAAARMYNLSISYKDSEQEGSIDRVTIIGLATEMLAREKGFVFGEEINNYSFNTYYFGSYLVSIIDMGLAKVIPSINVMFIRILSLIIGLAVSAIVIILRSMLDRTVKKREDLEKLTGVSVIAYISDQEGV